MKKLILILIFSAVFTNLSEIFAQNHDPIVKIPLMSIVGQWKVSYLGKLYKSFEGIPYAQPPIDDRRFQPPAPITTAFNKTIEATKEPNKCIQYDYEVGKVVGDEDCLYLNIYIPISHQEKLNSSLPVIIWFHEGAYQRGAGTETKAKYLMDRDVIFVTLNYRLGLFGFLSTGDNVVSGNMGLKDQNLAIRWVAKNIEHFGGDARKISLFGASAGGSSVQYHYLSKSSAGLFRNGVSFSGTALSLWAYDPEPRKTTTVLAEVLGCSNESSTDLIKCLKSFPADTLAGATKELLKRINGSPLYLYPPFSPVAEKNVIDYFIDRSPEEILRSGDVYGVPWTSGVLSDEGAKTILDVAQNNEAINYFNDNWEKVSANFFFFNRTLPNDKHETAAVKARDHYVGKNHFRNNEQTIRGLINMRSHKSFFTILEKATKLQARANKSPVYTYLYSYRAAKSLVGNDIHFGPTHLDDIFLVLENKRIDPTTTQNDREMLEIMLDFWYTAATTGEPKFGVSLPIVDPSTDEFQFLNIAKPNDYVLKSSGDFGEKKFWTSLGFDLKV